MVVKAKGFKAFMVLEWKGKAPDWSGSRLVALWSGEMNLNRRVYQVSICAASSGLECDGEVVLA